MLAILAAVLPAVAGVSTLWQAQAGLGAWGQVGAVFCGSHYLLGFFFNFSIVSSSCPFNLLHKPPLVTYDTTCLSLSVSFP